MKYLFIVILILAACDAYSQPNGFSVGQAIAQALKNNERIKSSDYELKSQQQLRKTSFDLPKTAVTLLYGQYNSYVRHDNNITISQTIPFSSFRGQGSLNRVLVTSREIKKEMIENEIVFQVKQIYHQLAFTNSHYKWLQRQDSIYEGFLRAASLRYQTGETNLLEQTTAEGQRNESKNLLRQIEAEKSKLKMELGVLMNAELPDLEMEMVMLSPENAWDTIGYKENPSLAYMRQQVEVAENEKKLQAARSAPDLQIGFFSQTLIGGPADDDGNIANKSDRFTGLQVGLSLPLWFVPHDARIKSFEHARQAVESNSDYYRKSLQGQLREAILQLHTYKVSLEYYNSAGLINAGRILNQSQVAFREGEIGYGEYLLGVRNAMAIEEGYLKTLNDYNQRIIYIEYLTGNK